MPEIFRKADWYVLCDEEKAFWEDTSGTTKWHPEAQSLSARTPELLIEPQDMPDIPGWEYKIHRLLDPNFLKPVTTDKYKFDRMNDFRKWIPTVVVSGRAREILEGVDPRGGQYFEYQYVDIHSGEIIQTDMYYWIPVNRFWFNRKKNPGKQPVERKLFHGPEPDSSGVWQLKNDERLREFVMQFPTWGMSTDHTTPFFRHDVFEKLVTAGMTGLLENRGEGVLIFGAHETVGHI